MKPHHDQDDDQQVEELHQQQQQQHHHHHHHQHHHHRLAPSPSHSNHHGRYHQDYPNLKQLPSSGASSHHQHQRQQQPDLLKSSPRPTRNISQTSLAESYRSNNLPPSFQLKPTQNPRVIENQWPPAPYGLENVPTLNTPFYNLQDPQDSKSHQSARFTRLLALQRPSISSSLSSMNPRNFSDTNLKNKPPIPPSLTLSLFSHLNDSSLSWTTKLKCFGATLAINLFLPFMNGIMLGFGEIAARELLGRYFGWGPAAHRYLKKSHELPGLVVLPDHNCSSNAQNEHPPSSSSSTPSSSLHRLPS